LVGNCSVAQIYEYTQDDVAVMKAALEAAVTATFERFAITSTKKERLENTFSLVA
jgi:hypothetical protein